MISSSSLSLRIPHDVLSARVPRDTHWTFSKVRHPLATGGGVRDKIVIEIDILFVPDDGYIGDLELFSRNIFFFFFLFTIFIATDTISSLVYFKLYVCRLSILRNFKKIKHVERNLNGSLGNF